MPTEGPQNAITIQLLDGIAIRAGDAMIALSSRKARGLVALLALSESHQMSRGAICAMLWPSVDSDRARASLRQTVKRLRKELGGTADKFLDFSRDSIAIKSLQCLADSEALVREIKAGDLPARLLSDTSPADQFLNDMDGLSPETDSWIAVQRRIFSDRVTQDLEKLIERVSASDEKCLLAARALALLDPTNEFARRAEMTALAHSGQAAAAVRVYDDLYRVLDEEYDIEPSAETVALVAKIKMGDFKSAPKAAPHPLSAIPDDPRENHSTIAIPPFTALSAGGLSPLTERFYQDLVSVLIRFREWNVVDGYVDDSVEKGYLLEGTESDDPSGETSLHITLRSKRTGRFLWSESLRLSYETWTANQWSIAQRFAAAINSNVSIDRLRRGARQVPGSESTFDRWLQCQDLTLKWQPDADLQAITMLENIIVEDPLFAPAHAELASIYNSRHLVFPGVSSRSDFVKKAMQHATVAIAIDPLETRSQRVAAWSHLMSGNFDLAEMHFLQALDLNTSNPTTVMSCAQGLAFCAKTETALALHTKARELQPDLPGYLQGYSVGVNFLSGRYEESVTAARLSKGTITNLDGWEAAALWELGRKDEAAKAANSLLNTLTPIWSGEDELGRESAELWFADSFPIRDETMRGRLNGGLRSALDHAASGIG